MTFPPHKCALYLNHNEHRIYYQSVAEYIQNHNLDEFKDQEAKARAIATDEIWELQMYPHTPISFCRAQAPTLEELMELVNGNWCQI